MRGRRDQGGADPHPGLDVALGEVEQCLLAGVRDLCPAIGPGRGPKTSPASSRCLRGTAGRPVTGVVGALVARRIAGPRTTRVLPQLGQRDSVALLAATTLEPDDDIATSIGRPPFSRDS